MHNLEIGSAGQVAFATRAEPAWHLLGTVFDKDEQVTTSEMLRKAHLDGWNVRLLEAPKTAEGVTLTDDRDLFYVVRDNPFTDGQVDRLAAVGERYRTLQNEELFSFGDAMLDGGQWETAGSIDGGRTVFGSLLLDHDMTVGGEQVGDVIKTYLLVVTSHNGSLALQAMVTPTRVVCQNTLGVALRGAKQTFKIRHTQSASGQVAEAKNVLGIAHGYANAFQADADAMVKVEVTNAQFFDIVADLYPKPENESKAALTRWDNKVSLLTGIFSGTTDGPDTRGNIGGTAWGAYNALTEALDWYRSPRKGQIVTTAAAASGFNPVINSEKARIHKRMLDFVS